MTPMIGISFGVLNDRFLSVLRLFLASSTVVNCWSKCQNYVLYEFYHLCIHAYGKYGWNQLNEDILDFFFFFP